MFIRPPTSPDICVRCYAMQRGSPQLACWSRFMLPSLGCPSGTLRHRKRGWMWQYFQPPLLKQDRIRRIGCGRVWTLFAFRRNNSILWADELCYGERLAKPSSGWVDSGPFNISLCCPVLGFGFQRQAIARLRPLEITDARVLVAPA